MAIGKHDNYKFYEGYEGEEELVFSTGEASLHIWDGYIEDIFGNPSSTPIEQDGLSKDYNEFSGPYADDCVMHPVDVEAYLRDARQYEGKSFDYNESKDVLRTIIKWLEQHKAEQITVRLN